MDLYSVRLVQSVRVILSDFQNKRICMCLCVVFECEWQVVNFIAGKKNRETLNCYHDTPSDPVQCFPTFSIRTLITELQSYLVTFYSNDSAHELKKKQHMSC